MAYAVNNFVNLTSPHKIEHIELMEPRTPRINRTGETVERRSSNRARLENVVVDRLVRRNFFKFWQQAKTVPCVLSNISFTGIGIESKDLIRIGDTVEVSLKSLHSGATQVIPVRICHQYRTESSYYSYGGTLEKRLNGDFRRLIVSKLTSLEAS